MLLLKTLVTIFLKNLIIVDTINLKYISKLKSKVKNKVQDLNLSAALLTLKEAAKGLETINILFYLILSTNLSTLVYLEVFSNN